MEIKKPKLINDDKWDIGQVIEAVNYLLQKDVPFSCDQSKLESHPQPTESWEFQECDTCAAKPGSPILCSGCLHNREAFDRLRLQAHQEGYNEAIAKAREMVNQSKIDIPTRRIHLKELGISRTNRRKRRAESERYNQALDDLILKLEK